MTNYLYKIHIPANRKAMTRLRLSSHKLMIERGRWLNILPKDRLCTLCNKLEDEFHVICECPRYDTCRKLYSSAQRRCPQASSARRRANRL